MALLLKHQTAAQFVARFREAYRNSEKDRLVVMAKWLLAKIQSGDVTDAQCRTAFGLSATQWNALKAKMQTKVAAWTEIESAVGE